MIYINLRLISENDHLIGGQEMIYSKSEIKTLKYVLRTISDNLFRAFLDELEKKFAWLEVDQVKSEKTNFKLVLIWTTLLFCVTCELLKE